MVNGVLPAPPTLILPTLITGAASSRAFRPPESYIRFRSFTPVPNTKLSGVSRIIARASPSALPVARDEENRQGLRPYAPLRRSLPVPPPARAFPTIDV